MNLITQQSAPVFTAGGTTVTGYAAPSRGTTAVSLWRVELAAGSSSPLHVIDAEEVFLGLEGRAVVVADGVESAVTPGDCLVVPAGTCFSICADAAGPFRAVVCMPAGGQATVLPDGPTFVPPWAL
ncbi:MAG: cupin domain-containing protein [Nakamurella sp.]